jgi:hypothetical protein
LEGRSAADFTAALAHFEDLAEEAVSKQGVQQLFYNPPMSASSKSKHEDAVQNGGVVYVPLMFVSVVDGVIRDVQAYESGF